MYTYAIGNPQPQLRQHHTHSACRSRSCHHQAMSGVFILFNKGRPQLRLCATQRSQERELAPPSDERGPNFAQHRQAPFLNARGLFGWRSLSLFCLQSGQPTSCCEGSAACKCELVKYQRFSLWESPLCTN
eukprot:1139249-Pelagomonas_calceolata.AAC.7